MLKIKNNIVEEKCSEINIKHRTYEKESIITVQINLEFFPKMIDSMIISGKADIKIDLLNIKSIDELCGKKYKGDIGYIKISVNNNGIWEDKSFDEFEVEFKERKENKLRIILNCDDMNFDNYVTIVSLYTCYKNINDYFDIKNFYEQPFITKIGNKEIFKYYFNK